MVYDGVVEKVFVRRNEDDIDALAAEANGKIKGKSSKSKGKGKASNGKGKRKARAGSSDEDDSSDSDDGSAKKKGKKGKSGKRATNGKAKKKRPRLYTDNEESSSESEDFDSDEEAPNKKKSKKKGKAGSDEDGEDQLASSEEEEDDGKKKKGSSKRRKKRDRTKKRVKRSSSDEESSDDEANEKNGGANGTDGVNGDGDEEAVPASASQYVYRVVRPYEPTIGWTDMPCGKCPVEEFCAEPPRMRAVAYKRPAEAGNASLGGVGGAPKTRIELEGGIQGVGMLGGAGASFFPPFPPLFLSSVSFAFHSSPTSFDPPHPSRRCRHRSLPRQVGRNERSRRFGCCPD
jgi:DNA-directed RNA polymerase III subunit RPC6